jgi:excisionase family DNA binding protein
MTRSPDLKTFAEAAVVLGCSVRTLQRLRASGQIGFTRRGSIVYFTPSDLSDYIESQHVAPTADGRERRKRKAS